MKTQKQRHGMKSTVMLLLAGALAVPGAMAAPKRLLVVSVTKGFKHDVIPTANQMLEDLAKKSGKFILVHVQTDQEMATMMTPAALKKYDGVIFNNTTGDLPLPDREGFLAWLKTGKAFVGLHAATDTFPGFPAFTEMIGAHFKIHGPQVEVEVINQDPKHPACKPYGSTFKVFDEIYQVKDFSRDQVHGLLTLDKHPNDRTPGDYPISWCKMYGKGRVFYTSLGHRKDVVTENPPENEKRMNPKETAQAYQKHVLGGILWALGLEKGSATPQTGKARK